MSGIKLIAQWKHGWKLTSVWVFLIVGAFPDIYNALISAGLHDQLPETAKLWLRSLAALGIVLRLIRQQAVSHHLVQDNDKRPDNQ